MRLYPYSTRRSLYWLVLAGSMLLPVLPIPRNVALLSASSNKGGKHLVLVDYATNWDSVHEWVYNASDLNASQVLFAHLRSDRENRQLMDHFPGRTAWIVRLGPAQSDVHLERYESVLARSAP